MVEANSVHMWGWGHWRSKGLPRDASEMLRLEPPFPAWQKLNLLTKFLSLSKGICQHNVYDNACTWYFMKY